jgi:surface carbohydrate biosynthesis protein (TIGR04326 family)
VRPGFSFWWTTMLAEKSNAFNSTQIIGVLKLMALEHALPPGWRGRIVLASGDGTLARAFIAWCRNAGLEFEWRRCPETSTRESAMRRLQARLPHGVRAAATLLSYLLRRWPLKGTGMRPLAQSQARITFCSYLLNLDQNAARSGRFSSGYWTELHAALGRSATDVNWLLMFIGHDFVPTARRARELIEQLNQGHQGARTDGMQALAAVEGALGVRIVLRTLRDYLRVARAARRLHAAREHFRLPESGLDLWPFFEQDWHGSLRGSAAITNCLFLNLFEEVLGRLPSQQWGLYLQENIGWEAAFVHCWKAAGHGRLVGVPHSTIRFWDLRYFSDPRSYARAGRNDLPLPDLVALNGPAGLELLRHAGFPQERIVEVEALRYLHLADMTTATDDAPARPDALRVLCLGDYVEKTTRQQMQWLALAAAELPPGTRYVVKPHPACPIDPKDYPTLTMQLTNAPLGKLFAECDVAYTSNMTSAAVDAYCGGVPVVSVLDGEAFNISPLRGISGVRYVTHPGELAAALRTARAAGAGRGTGYFFLDKSLPRWRRLLGLRESA